MAPADDDSHDRQLAALRRYVADLDVHRHHGARGPTGGRRRRRVLPWLAATLLLMAVSLAGGIAIGSRGDRAAGSPAPAGTTVTSAVASPTATPECVEAVARANLAIGHAVRLSGALREHAAVMNDRDGGADAALRSGTPSLIEGTAAAARFEVAVADYRKVADRCPLGTS